MAYNEGAIVQGTVVEMQPPVARVLSMEAEGIEVSIGDGGCIPTTVPLTNAPSL